MEMSKNLKRIESESSPNSSAIKKQRNKMNVSMRSVSDSSDSRRNMKKVINRLQVIDIDDQTYAKEFKVKVNKKDKIMK